MMNNKVGACAVAISCWLPLAVSAHVPEIATPADQQAIITIDDYITSYAFYGELSGWPHRYEFTAQDEFRLYLRISEPAINERPQEDFSVIVIKQLGRGVEEVTRLLPSDASWEAEYEPFGGDTYYRGGRFDETLAPGRYAIEVSTPDNAGKYTLAVGYEEDFSDVGFFGTLSGIYDVKRFFEKPALAVFQSPFYYIPSIVFIMIALCLWWYVRRRG